MNELYSTNIFHVDCKYMRIIMLTVVVQNELENNLHSSEHYLSSSDKKGWNKFRPEQDLNLWPLWYQSSALPTRPTSQLGTGHFVAMYLFSDRSHLMSRYCYSKNKNMFLPHVDACYDLHVFSIETQGKIESICNTYTVKTCR